MAIELPELPYAMDALEPHISRETLEYHYGKHHQGYVNKLNAALPGSEFEDSSLERIVRNAGGSMFNNAAQIWNHSFYWSCLSPNGGGRPDGKLAQAIDQAFGGFDAFKTRFSRLAGSAFGSGWAWLVQEPDGRLTITTTGNAGTPLTSDDRALLTCDVWEHAYYIDYRNARAGYIDAFWQLVNWPFVESNMR